MAKTNKPDAVVAIGVFDGLHAGHRALIAHALEEARARGVSCVVVTFAPDPAEVVARPVPNTRLLSCADRLDALRGTGADEVVPLSFTPELAALPCERFVAEVLCTRMRPVSVHVGQNFRFGVRGSGDVQTLRVLGDRFGFEVHAHGLVASGGEPVSSTRIRGLLAAGRLREANDLLGRSHFVRGRVVHGRGEGTSFGFPTANVRCDPMDCLPAEGVYACYVMRGEDVWPAAANVGAPPSFSASEPAFLEANLIGFEGDLYDAEVVVTFEAWLRASRVFDSLEELEQTVLGNIAWVREHLLGRSSNLFEPSSQGGEPA